MKLIPGAIIAPMILLHSFYMTILLESAIPLEQLNNAIEIGMQQLEKGQKVTAKDAYQRIKAKLSVLKSD